MNWVEALAEADADAEALLGFVVGVVLVLLPSEKLTCSRQKLQSASSWQKIKTTSAHYTAAYDNMHLSWMKL